MAEIILITGGSRSGKSAFAERTAEALPGPRAYVATCPVIDPETEERIRKHREARRGRGWQTIEETVDLAGVIRRAGACRVLLVDCLTLWLSNVLLAQRDDEIEKLLLLLPTLPGLLLFVSNEVGGGIVPDNALARRFRDEQGRLNQRVAAVSQQVTLVVAGLPLVLKSSK
ncbi:MAG: bifunctional adenosylcobinamide kinase/adenosylcobinamide-phosphate guanylyltransferase [Syntrophales bacterium]|nr:bifunctional adenosylcobinamide kinase/adenosylcobinamide-phosphate guanylyltransferase [Syntrophales bacterium]